MRVSICILSLASIVGGLLVVGTQSASITSPDYRDVMLKDEQGDGGEDDNDDTSYATSDNNFDNNSDDTSTAANESDVDNSSSSSSSSSTDATTSTDTPEVSTSGNIEDNKTTESSRNENENATSSSSNNDSSVSNGTNDSAAAATTTNETTCPSYSMPVSMESIITPLVLTGRLANYDQFPYHSIVFLTDDRKLGIFCSGVFVTRETVLTVAHCLYNNDGELYKYVRVTDGNVDRYDVRFMTWLDLSGASVVHPDFDSRDKNMQHDLAMIFLDRAVAVERIRTVSLEIEIDLSKNYYIVGYGRDSDGIPNQFLRELAVKPTDNSTCLAVYGETVCSKSVLTTFGKGSLDNSVCRLESGAPLLAKHALGSMRLVGMASFVTNRNCNIGNLDGYTSIVPHRGWIREHARPMLSNEPIVDSGWGLSW